MKLISLLTAGILCLFAGTANAICPHACSKNGSVSTPSLCALCVTVLIPHRTPPVASVVCVLLFSLVGGGLPALSPFVHQARTINALAISGQTAIQVKSSCDLSCVPASSSHSSVCVLAWTGADCSRRTCPKGTAWAPTSTEVEGENLGE